MIKTDKTNEVTKQPSSRSLGLKATKARRKNMVIETDDYKKFYESVAKIITKAEFFHQDKS